MQKEDKLIINLFYLYRWRKLEGKIMKLASFICTSISQKWHWSDSCSEIATRPFCTWLPQLHWTSFTRRTRKLKEETHPLQGNWNKMRYQVMIAERFLFLVLPIKEREKKIDLKSHDSIRSTAFKHLIKPNSVASWERMYVT